VCFWNVICNNSEFALKGSRTLSKNTCLIFFLFFSPPLNFPSRTTITPFGVYTRGSFCNDRGQWTDLRLCWSLFFRWPRPAGRASSRFLLGSTKTSETARANSAGSTWTKCWTEPITRTNGRWKVGFCLDFFFFSFQLFALSLYILSSMPNRTRVGDDHNVRKIMHTFKYRYLY